MKKIILVILIFMSVLPAMSQVSEKSKVYFGFNAGVGQNTNGYRLTPDKYGFNYYEGDLHFTSGINFSYFATNRLRPRLEFRYSEMKYGFNWSDSYTELDYTDTKLYTINLNLNLDFLVLNGKRFQFFLSPGIVTEFNTGNINRNYFTDGSSNIKNYNVITDQFRPSIAGANISAIAKYKFDEYLGITVTPGYNYYFKDYVDSNDKRYSRSLINFGVEYTF